MVVSRGSRRTKHRPMIPTEARRPVGLGCVLRAALIAFLSLNHTGFTYSDEVWLGKRVVPRSSDFKLGDAGKSDGRRRPATLIYVVERAEGVTLGRRKVAIDP